MYRRRDSMKFLRRTGIDTHRKYTYVTAPFHARQYIYIYISSLLTHTHTAAPTFVRLLLKGRAVQIIPGNCSSNGKRNSSINVSSRFSWLITWKTDERPRHKIPESSTKLIKRPFRRPVPFHFTPWSGAYRIDGDGIGRLSPSMMPDCLSPWTNQLPTNVFSFVPLKIVEFQISMCTKWHFIHLYHISQLSFDNF